MAGGAMHQHVKSIISCIKMHTPYWYTGKRSTSIYSMGIARAGGNIKNPMQILLEIAGM
jgi:hypothetical protein